MKWIYVLENFNVFDELGLYLVHQLETKFGVLLGAPRHIV